MPRKTLNQAHIVTAVRRGFNEAAARCRGKRERLVRTVPGPRSLQ